MMIKRDICFLVNHLRQSIKWFHTDYRLIFCEDLPDEVQKGEIYIAGDKDHEWYVGMQCPCGCGEVIELSLIPHRRPRWTICWDLLGTISINPSIWRTNHCRSHFYLTKGHVRWCPNNK